MSIRLVPGVEGLARAQIHTFKHRAFLPARTVLAVLRVGDTGFNLSQRDGAVLDALDREEFRLILGQWRIDVASAADGAGVVQSAKFRTFVHL